MAGQFQLLTGQSDAVDVHYGSLVLCRMSWTVIGAILSQEDALGVHETRSFVMIARLIEGPCWGPFVQRVADLRSALALGQQDEFGIDRGVEFLRPSWLAEHP